MAFPNGQQQVNLDNAWNSSKSTIENTWRDICSRLDDLADLTVDDAALADAAEGTATVAIGLSSLGDLAYAIAAFLFLWLANWTLGKIGDWLKGISILGVHPFGFLGDAIASNANNLEKVFDAVADRVRALALDPIHMIQQVFARQHNATNSMQRKIHTVTAQRIPQAAGVAQTNAEKHADSLAKSLQDNIDAATTQEQHDVKSLQDNIDKLRTYVDGAFKDLIEADIRTAQGNAEAYSHAQLVAVEQDIVNRLSGDEAILSGLSTTVAVTIPTEITDAVNASYQKEQGNLVTATQTLQGEMTALQKEIDAVNARITADEATITSAEAAIANLNAEAATYASDLATQQAAIKTAQDDIATNTQELTSLSGQLTTATDNISTLQAQQLLNDVQLAPFEAPGAPTLALSIATIAGGLSAIKTEIDNCMVTTCDGPNSLKNQLMNLLQLLTAAGELGFIAEAIAQPISTANALAPVLDTIDNNATDIWNALLRSV